MADYIHTHPYGWLLCGAVRTISADDMLSVEESSTAPTNTYADLIKVHDAQITRRSETMTKRELIVGFSCRRGHCTGYM